MDKELKNELRRDEVGDALQEARKVLTRPEVVKPVLATLGLVVVLLGLYYGQKFRAASAESAFARASEVFHADVDASPASPSPSAPATSYKTANEKYEKAMAMFDQVAKSYGSLPAGPRARYYSALCLLELNRTKEAEEALKQIAAVRTSGGIEPAMARLRLAELVMGDGRSKDAAKLYEALIADEASGLPKDRLLFGFAEALEKAGERLPARRAYTDLVNRHPQSPYAQDARQKMDALADL